MKATSTDGFLSAKTFLLNHCEEAKKPLEFAPEELTFLGI